MDKSYDEPQYIDVDRIFPEGEQEKKLQVEIKKLCDSQPFAVLATQGKDITNASLISFAMSDDLKYIVFATPVNTTKYDFVFAQENVSVLVDDRSLQQDHINEISALTIVGKGKILLDGEEILRWSGRLIQKHPNLKTFVEAETTSLILIQVVKHLYVNKFQQMREWDPR